MNPEIREFYINKLNLPFIRNSVSTSERIVYNPYHKLWFMCPLAIVYPNNISLNKYWIKDYSDPYSEIEILKISKLLAFI